MKKIKRLETNQRALLEGITFYKSENERNVASVEVLQLSYNDFQRYYDDLQREAYNLELKVKRLESASRTVTNTVYKIETQWRDSIIYVENEVIVRIDTARCVRWRDPYLRFDACDINGILTANIAIQDTLVQFVHRIPKRIWFIKYGTKAIKQDVTVRNPHTNIVYTEYIKLF
jgi:hypothetical protein